MYDTVSCFDWKKQYFVEKQVSPLDTNTHELNHIIGNKINTEVKTPTDVL